METHPRQIEQDLRISEAKFATAFNAGPIILTITRLSDGRLIEVNESFLNTTGFTREEVLGRTPFEIGLWIDPQQRLDALGRLREGLPVRAVEANFRTKHGAPITALMSADLIEIAGETCVLTALTDITARKQAEQALRESEERLRMAVEVGAVGIWDIDLRSGARMWSEQGKKIYGLAPHEQMDYARQLALVHPDDRARVHALVTAFRDQGTLKQLDFQHRIIRPDGTLCWVAVRGEAIYEGGTLPVRLIGTLVDITERKEAEAQANFLADMAERIRLAGDAEALLADVVRAVGEQLQVDRCFFIDIDVASDHAVIRHDYCRGVPSVAGEYRVSDYSAEALAQAEAGHTIVNCDSQIDPRTAATYDKTYGPQGERAYVSVPLRREGQWKAILWVSTDRPRQWQPREIALLETVAERAWLAIEKLRLEAHLRFQAQVLAQVRDAVIAVDNEQRITYWNRGAEQLYGLPAQATLGWPLMEIVQYRWPHPEDEQASWAALASTGAWSGENIHRVSDGREITVESSVSALVDERGQPIGLLAVVRDIGARKRAAAASALLAAASSALATAGHDQAAMLESVAGLLVPAFADLCIIHIVADDGTIQLRLAAHADPAKQALLDPPASNGVADFLHVIRTGRPELYSDLSGDLPGGAAADSAQGQALRALGIGSCMCVPFSAREQILGALTLAAAESGRRYDSADLDLAQELARRLALALDNARLYAAEQRARAVAELAVQVRDQFFSLAAHELKNPLTSLLGNTQLLERRAARGSALSERDRRSVQQIAQQASRLNTLIATLLDVSRIEMGQLTLDRAPLDLGALIQRIVEELRPTLSQHTLVYMPAAEPLLIDGDALRLEQVIQNLLGNAVKYSPGGGQVTVQALRRGPMAGVVVTDQGIGIPAEALPKLFQRFYRVENGAARQIGGSGIGLYVVNEIVTLHGGEVTVTSAEGQGSTFTIWLPLALTM